MTAAKNVQRLVERGKQVRRPATDNEFRAAVLAAWEALSHGTFGAYVRRNEPWDHALVEEASTFLLEEGLGRPVGVVPDTWREIIRAAAAQPSAAPDGMVQAYAPAGHAGTMRIPLRTVPRTPR